MRATTLRAIALLAAWAAQAVAAEPSPPPAPPAAGPPPRGAPFDEGFLPTADLRTAPFRAAHPEDDGRGVLVAVLDTGVDPGHPRLARTTTGEPKVIDMLDATDDGLVATEVPVELHEGKALGASGRLLTLGAHVTAGKGAWLGRIDATNVLPPRLVDRLRTTRRERLQRALARAEAAGAPAPAPREGESQELAQARTEEERRARALLPDESPVFDLLLAEGSKGWRVVIDTDADGDLAEETALEAYGVAQAWVRLGDDAELNVGVQPEPEARRVRLLFDGNGHGTHVAGIVAGYEAPDSPWNGVAPGARILSIKVGNSRFGGPTTNFSILKALAWAGERGARVVNLSFGGSSFAGDAGTPDARAADAVVERHGLICCFSAGNEGPALSTVGSPASARRVISVGAYVSPATMQASYAQLGPDPGERLFGFSSRGPLPGGDLGISLVAPGAAWSPLPSWQLVAGDNWHGTSMAAPQVSGAVALLVGAAERVGVPADPARLARALRVSARPVPSLLPIEQGAGLVQVDGAFEALRRMKDLPAERELRARVVNATGVGGGLYLRPCLAVEPFDRDVAVEVDWPRDVPNAAKCGYERRLLLAADRPWIQVPARLGLNADGGRFAVRIDPRGLAEGLHVGLVRAMDPARPLDGPELVVPVTLVKPTRVDASGRWRGEVDLAPGERVSRFLLVPYGASKARLRLLAREGTRNELTVAMASLDAWRRQEDRVGERRVRLAGGEEQESSTDVLPGTVLEVVLFSHWERNHPATYDLDLRFEGPVSPDASLEAGPGEDVVLVRLASPLAPFQGRLTAKVDAGVERPLVTREVVAEGPTDWLDGGRLFLAKQSFDLEIGAGERLQVVPLGSAALDEQREDAHWTVTDPAGRVVSKAVIDGPFPLAGLAAGRYRLAYETPAWGQRAAETSTTGFEVRRARPDAWGSVFPTADLAAEDRGGEARVELPLGAVRSFAVRLPGLEAGRLHAGVVEVRDEADRVRWSVPLRIDRRTDATPTNASGATEALVLALRRGAEAGLAQPLAEESVLRGALGEAHRARALRPEDRELDLLALRLEAALATDPAVRGLALARADAVVERFPVGGGGDGAARARALLAREVLRRAEGLPVPVAPAPGTVEPTLPATDDDLLADRVRRGLAEGGDPRDALAAARTLAERHPASARASGRVIEVLLRLGWAGPAAAELRRWPTTFPRETAAWRTYARRVRDAGGDPAPRTLEALSVGAP